MFGEYKSQSPKLPSPWSNPYINVSRSKLSTPNPIVINYLPCDLLDSSLSEFSTFQSDDDDENNNNNSNSSSRNNTNDRDIDETLPSAESLEETTEDDSVSEPSFKRPTTESEDYDQDEIAVDGGGADNSNSNSQDDDDQPMPLAISFDSSGRIRKSNRLAKRIPSTESELGPSSIDGLQRLSAEVDEKGHIEYKLKLSAATPDRFNRLVTQLQWRLLEGGGEAIYEIGVLDDGTLIGLPRSELLSSLRTLERMAEELGATVLVVKEIRLPALSTSTLDLGDDTGKRAKWLKWAASQETASNREQRRSTKWEAKLAQMNGAHQASTGGKPPAGDTHHETGDTHGQRFINRFGTAGRRRRRGPRHRTSDHPRPSPSLSSDTHSERFSQPEQSEHRSLPVDSHRPNRGKKIESLLDSDDDDDDYTNPTFYPKPNPNGANSVQHQSSSSPPTVHETRSDSQVPFKDIDLEMFAVLDIGLEEDLVGDLKTATKPESVGVGRKHGEPYPDKKSKDEAKAAARRLAKSEKAAAAARSSAKPVRRPDGEKSDDDLCFLTPLSLDDADYNNSSNNDEEKFIRNSLLATPTGPGDVPLPSPHSCLDHSSSADTTSATSDINPLPSPILSAYRPPPSLLPRSGLVSESTKVVRARPRTVSSTTTVGPDIDSNVNNDEKRDKQEEEIEDDDEEDGSERLCVEVLVMRKEMKTFINLEDFGAKVLSDRD